MGGLVLCQASLSPHYFENLRYADGYTMNLRFRRNGEAFMLLPVFDPARNSMSRTIIHSDRAPQAIGPYSQAVRVGDTIYFSGQTPIDPATGALVAGDVAAQARRVFENLKAVATAAGIGFDRVVRVGIYMTDLSHFAAVNAVMAEYFNQPYPARSTIEVKGLPKAAQVEIDMIAVAD
jgi:reactive intermediate/imine deaminase